MTFAEWWAKRYGRRRQQQSSPSGGRAPADDLLDPTNMISPFSPLSSLNPLNSMDLSQPRLPDPAADTNVCAPRADSPLAHSDSTVCPDPSPSPSYDSGPSPSYDSGSSSYDSSASSSSYDSGSSY